MQITREQAEQIVDVLVAKAGLSFPHDTPDEQYEREHTVGLITSGEHRELRICYKFGFGGKLWMNSGRVYVNTYRETETDAMHAEIQDVNRDLAKIMGHEPVLWERVGAA